MALFTQEELPILKSASEVKSVSDTAEFESEKIRVAKLINSSANTGQYVVLYNHDMSDKLKELLEGQGYKIKNLSKYISADPQYQYEISWKG